MTPIIWRALVCATAVVASAPTAWGQVRLEYIAHASFVVQSPEGTRVLIDPYNGRRWLGYGFPENVEADVVLITHPHYDHDAAYYAGGQTPVLRRPGRYRFGDVDLEGLEAKHADPYGMDFGQLNTLWVVETGGIRLAHLGDTGALSRAELDALGRVDVLLLPVDGQYHILTATQIEQIVRAVEPSLTVPMHYRIPRLSPLPESLGPIDPWLAGRDHVERASGHAIDLRPADLTGDGRVLVLEPSPRVEPWSSTLERALAEAERAQDVSESDPEQAVAYLRAARRLAPNAIVLVWQLGEALVATGRAEEAVRVLERGLAGAGLDDVQYTMRARRVLAGLYRDRGLDAEAAQQYRLILAMSDRRELRAEAEAFLRPGQ